MYFITVQQFAKTLTNLQKIIDKTIHDAETRKFDPNNFMTSRLAPDMFPFSRQIQIACDVAKAAAAAMTASEAPKFEDNETTMLALRDRLQKTISYLNSLKAANFSDIDPNRSAKLTHPAGKGMRVEDLVISRAIPNFFFHVTVAYALLRQGGVPLGKMDFLGELKIFDL